MHSVLDAAVYEMQGASVVSAAILALAAEKALACRSADSAREIDRSRGLRITFSRGFDGCPQVSPAGATRLAEDGSVVDAEAPAFNFPATEREMVPVAVAVRALSPRRVF